MLKRGCLLLLGTLLGSALAQECVLPSSPPPDRSRVVFILDTSGSMQGLGDGQANIFGKVQAAIVRGMRATQAPGSVELLTFDKGPRQRFSFPWPARQGQFEKTVNALQADGANTWLYASMTNMFTSLVNRDDTATTVYVITDGQDNNPNKAETVRTALDAFNVSRGPFDKLFYIALGAAIPAEVEQAFAETDFAQTIKLKLNQAPDFTSSLLAPGMVNVDEKGTFPYRRPANTTLELESPNIGGAEVTIANPTGQGEKVELKIDGRVAAGAVGYMCAHLPDGNQNILLRFQRETPPAPIEKQVPVQVLGTLKLLNPNEPNRLKRGQSTTWRYRAEGGPVTVELLKVPPEIEAALPDAVVSLLPGQIVTVKVTDKSLVQDQQAAPTLKINDQSPLKVPPVQGVVPRPFPWYWLLLPLLLIPLIWWLRRELRPLEPYALSIDKTLRRVSLHDKAGWKKTKVMRRDTRDIGEWFRQPRLRGLVLQRFRPEPEDGEEVILDNSNLKSIRSYGVERLRRAVKLQAQPELLRLQKDKREPGDFLLLEENLERQLLYIFTDIERPKVRVRPPEAPPEPPIEVIVSFLAGQQMQELELPLGDVDLADVFGHEGLRGVVVRREPGLLRLRALDPGMTLRHISRPFQPGEALPLAVMLDLRSADGHYQIRVRDKGSMARYQR